ARRANGPEIAAHEDRAALIAIGPTGDLLADPHRREFGTPLHQGVDLGLIRVEETGARCAGERRGMVQLQRRGHGPSRAVESARDGPDGELVDLGQPTDLRPQTDVHGEFLSSSAWGSPAARRKISPRDINPAPGSRRRCWPAGGRESTWVK